MLCGVTVDVNGLCLEDETEDGVFRLSVGEENPGPCTRINRAIARCRLPKVSTWGTRTVYFQKGDSSGGGSKAFVGFIYFGNSKPSHVNGRLVAEWSRILLQCSC